jgi:hypothetical protein
MADTEILYAVYQDRGPHRPLKMLAMDRTQREASALLESYRTRYLAHGLTFFIAPYTAVNYGYV